MTLEEIIERGGGAVELARVLNLHRATVSHTWRRAGRVPVEHARAISEKLDIPLHEIRPDVWRPADAA